MNIEREILTLETLSENREWR